jgi:hypothetical protein
MVTGLRLDNGYLIIDKRAGHVGGTVEHTDNKGSGLVIYRLVCYLYVNIGFLPAGICC